MVEAEKSKNTDTATPVEATKPKAKTSRLKRAIQTGLLIGALFGSPSFADAGGVIDVGVLGVGKHVASAVEVTAWKNNNPSYGQQQGGVAVSGVVAAKVGNVGLAIAIPEIAIPLGKKSQPAERSEVDNFFSKANFYVAPPVKAMIAQTIQNFPVTNPGQSMFYASEQNSVMVYVQKNDTIIETDQIVPLNTDGSVEIIKKAMVGMSKVTSAVTITPVSDNQVSIQQVPPPD